MTRDEEILNEWKTAHEGLHGAEKLDALFLDLIRRVRDDEKKECAKVAEDQHGPFAEGRKHGAMMLALRSP